MKMLFKTPLLVFVICLATLISGCATPSDPYKGMSAKQLYDTAERAVSRGNYKKSVTYYEALNSRYPFGAYAEQAQLDVIYAYSKNEDPASALAAADSYIHLYPRSKHVDYAYYMKGVINYDRAKDWFQHVLPTDPAKRDLSTLRLAFQDFNELIRVFPHSKFVPDAHKRMIYIRDVLAKHELQVARFYYTYKAYLAAANRASVVVQHYEGTPSVEESLVVMVESYRALGLKDLANDAYRLLKSSYPKSKAIRSLA